MMDIDRMDRKVFIDDKGSLDPIIFVNRIRDDNH